MDDKKYSNAAYVNAPLTQTTSCIRCDIDGVASFVPLDPANTDYANIMALVEANKLTIAAAESTTNIN